MPAMNENERSCRNEGRWMAGTGLLLIMPNVLVAEDEAAIADAVLYALRSEGIEAEHCLLGRDVVPMVRAGAIRRRQSWTWGCRTRVASTCAGMCGFSAMFPSFS